MCLLFGGKKRDGEKNKETVSKIVNAPLLVALIIIITTTIIRANGGKKLTLH